MPIMLKVRNGASTVFFIFASSLFIASAFISILVKATAFSEMSDLWAYAITTFFFFFFVPALIFHFKPLCKKRWAYAIILFLGIGVILISLLILRIIDQAYGESILYLLFGEAKGLPQSSLWAMLGFSIILISLILLLLSTLLILSKHTIFFPARFLLLWISRWLGKTYRFLITGCPAPVIRLADVAIIVWLIEKAYNGLIASSSRMIIDGTSQINGIISNVTYLGARYAQGSLLDGPSDGLLLNMDSPKGVIVYWNYFGDNFFYAMVSSIITTISFHWEKILVIWFLLEVIILVMRTSHQLSIVVEDFTNSPPQETKADDKAGKGADRDEPNPSGLADLLATNLNRISELYKDVDEQRAIRSESGAGRPVEATLKSGEIGDILKSSTSENSEIGLGPISVPLGSVTSMIGRLMQGPRITIGLHKTKDTTKEKGDIFYLTATMTGSEPYSWVVDEQISLDSDSKTRPIDDMVSELSHRIFAKLAFGEPGKVVPWKAIWNFNEGLRAYRDCLHSVKKRQYYLKDAEKHFINAAEEEDDSIKAYYNLGVVYTELQQLDSAEVAFSRAIKKNPNEWEAYYALGLNIYDRARDQEELSHSYHHDIKLLRLCNKTITEQYTKVVDLSDYIIKLKEKDSGIILKDYRCLAKAYNLKGDAMSHLARIDEKNRESICSVETSVKNSGSGVQKIDLINPITCCKKAAYYSLLALLKSEFWEDDLTDARKLFSECLIDLADLYLLKQKSFPEELSYSMQNFSARKSLEQAISVNPYDSNLYLHLGKAHCQNSSNKYDEAARKIYEFGSKMAPEDDRFKACLGCIFYKKWNKEVTHNELMCKERAFQLCDSIMVYGPDACSAALEMVAKVYGSMEEAEQCRRLENASFLARLKDDAKKGDSIIKCLKMMLECGGKEEGVSGNWKSAAVFATLIKLLDDLDSIDNDSNETKNIYENHIKIIIDKLKNDYHRAEKGWERAQVLYSYSYLSYLYYNYWDDSFRKAREMFDRHEHYLKSKRPDDAHRCLTNSINFLENNKIQDNSDFDKKIESLNKHLKDDSIFIGPEINVLDALFNEIYQKNQEKKQESENCLANAKNVLKCKLDTYKLINGESNPIEARDYKNKKMYNKLQRKISDIISEAQKLSHNKEAIDELENALKNCADVYLRAVDAIENKKNNDKIKAQVDLFDKESINTLEEINEIFIKDNKNNSSIIKTEFPRKYSMYVQEYSQLLIESGQLYLNMKKPREAETAFQEAINLLEDERPQDIKSRSLWTKLSRSQSEQRKEMSNALKGAQKGRMSNPLGYDERRELGSIFCDLEEFDFGMQELDYAQSWKPDKPEILVEMAQSYVKQAKKCDDKEHRKKILTAASDKLNQALRIYDKSLITKRGVARYWLGKVHYEMGNYKKAIPHFRILYNVRSAKIHSDRDTLIIALRLAYAYLKAKSFDESDRLFDQIISEGVKFKEDAPDNILGEKYEDFIYPNEIIIRAYLGKSISCIERNGNPGIALDNARLAKKDIGSLEDCNKGTNSREYKEDYQSRMHRLNADYEDCMGWICYDLGLIDEAIYWLEKSVSEQAGPSAYFHLAMAYKGKIDLWDLQSKRDPLIARKASKCCRLAKELDLNEEYEKDLDELIKSLTDKLAEKSPAKNKE